MKHSRVTVAISRGVDRIEELFDCDFAWLVVNVIICEMLIDVIFEVVEVVLEGGIEVELNAIVEEGGIGKVNTRIKTASVDVCDDCQWISNISVGVVYCGLEI